MKGDARGIIEIKTQKLPGQTVDNSRIPESK